MEVLVLPGILLVHLLDDASLPLKLLILQLGMVEVTVLLRNREHTACVFRSRTQGQLNPATSASSKPLSFLCWGTVLLWLQCSPGLTRICSLLSSASPGLGLSGVHCHVRFAHWFSTNSWFRTGTSHAMKLSLRCWFNFPVLHITKKFQ